MTDVAVHPIPAFRAGLHVRRLAALLERSLRRVLLAEARRRALDDLPANILKDIGLRRSDGPADPDTIARGDHDRDVPVSRLKLERAPAARFLPRLLFGVALAIAADVATSAVPARVALAQDAQVKRGSYLVTLGGCNDCHTPGYFFGKPDKARMLGGSEVGFEIPGLGVFHGPNLTPDAETGLGSWSTEEIVRAITKGERPDGRVLAPIMPWHAFANLTRQDVRAIVAFLKSLPPVKNKVPGPFGPSETPTSFVMKIVPPATANESAMK
jgi:mono/diheme cytochrome c family protein/uncharacterized protein YjiS (DUF1127 family)